MTTPSPITPPPELSDEQVGEWLIDDGYPWGPSEQAVITITTNRLKNVARQAFQAGADQELKACCQWLAKPEVALTGKGPNDLRAALRPKPPSLKEQALALINHDPANQPFLSDKGIDTIRRALEQPPDHEMEPTSRPMTDFRELCARIETLEAAAQKHIVETSANILALASRIEALESAKRQSSKVLDLSDLLQWTPEQAQKLKDLLEGYRNQPGLNE